MTNEGLIAEARKLLEDYPHYQEYPGGPLLKYPHHDALERLANALEASVARVKELEAQVKDFKCEQVFRISEMQELLEAQQRISELEAKLAAVPDAATELRAERDAALAAIERVRVAHRRYTYYELEDSCTDMTDEHREEHHHESYEIGEFYCDQMPTGDVVCDLCRDADGERMAWPCPTIAALDGAPEPEEKP